MNTQFGAWIAAAITALQITLNSVGMPAQQISNFLADPFNVTYTYQDSQLDQYFDQSNIQILPGNTIIDGQVYDDVWLSESAAEIFRVNAFDFATAYSIASNTNGTYASGLGTAGGAPLFRVGNNIKSQMYKFPCEAGTYPLFGNTSVTVSNITEGQNYKVATLTLSNGDHWNGRIYNNSCGALFSSNDYNLPATITLKYGNYSSATTISPAGSSVFDTVSEPFSFDYVAGTIPIDNPLEDDQGLLLHVPHHSGTSHFEDFLIDNPEFSEPGGVVVDPTIDPDINTKLDDLINIIAPLIPVIQASFDVAPTPVPPAPGETIADTDYSVLDNILQSIHNAIQAIPQAISSLGDRILQDIEEGPIRVFDKVLDIFRTIFAPVIALITSGLSIWSYVLSWLNTISAPFTFMLSVVPSGIMVPIYAAIAGYLCISIFRRFGR